MEAIRLYLIGTPVLERNGVRIELGRRKALALLSYLAVTGKSHPREALATLLWPEAAPDDSRAALRRVLSDLNKALGEGWSSVTYNSAGINLEADLQLDVHEFRKLLGECKVHNHLPLDFCPDCLERLNRAVDLYRDHFLAGFNIPDAPDFDEWQFFEGEALRRECSTALETLAGYALSHPNPDIPVPDNSIIHARRWAALEPLNESAHASLMQLYAAAGQHSAALRQYRTYARFLEQEVDESPSQAIQNLFERIRKSQTGQWTESSSNKQPKFENISGANTANLELAGQVATQQTSSSKREADSTATGEIKFHPYRVEEEIRLATALFVGLVSDIQNDWQTRPEKVTEAARLLVSIVNRTAIEYSAYVEHFMGQGMFVLFGLPQVHEDDAERALLSALDVIKTAQEAGLSVAAGVCTGQIYYTLPPVPMGANEHTSTTPMLIGPALNQAARLQNLASPGKIFVNAATYHQTRGAFEFEKAEALSTGAIETDSNIYCLIAAQEIPQKSRGLEDLLTPLVGREAELARMKSALAGVLRGQGFMLALVGEAGIGKSRLIYELKQSAISAWEQGNLLLWIESRCQEWRKSTSYWSFIDLFHNLLHFFADNESGRGNALADLLEEMAERGDLPANRVEEIGALLGNLLSIRFGNHWDLRLKNANPEQVQRQTYQAIYDFLVALSHQQPLVLVFEDLHWADDLSLDLLSLLMEAVPANPLLIFCLYRPTQARQGQRMATIADQKIPGTFSEIHLRELLPEQSLYLVRCILGETMPGNGFLTPNEHRLADQLFDLDFFLSKSWGNPFFVEEAIRALVNQGVLYRHAGYWQMRAGVKSLSIPESLQSLILSRVDSLDTDLKTVLRSAAILGRRFPVSILTQIIPDNIPVEHSLWALEEAALIYRQHVLPEVEYAFKHALIQDVVYQTIASHQRTEFHRMAAETQEKQLVQNGETSEAIEQIAYHYQRSSLPEKALEYLLKAGENARRSYRNREAVDYFHQALDLWDQTTSPEDHKLPEKSKLRLNWKLAALTGLGQIYHGMGEEVEAEKYLLQAIAVGKAVELDTPALVRLYYWLGEALHWQRRYGEQVHLGQVGLELLAEEQNESLEAALMNQIIAIGHLGRGDEAAFKRLTENTARFIEKLPYSEELRPAYVHIILSLYNDRLVAQAERWLDRLHNLAQIHHDLRALAEVYDYQWGYAFQRGDLRQALEGCRRALELYPQVGDSFRIWRCQRDMAWGHLMIGELEPAAEYASRSLFTAMELGVTAYQTESQLVSGLVHLSQNDSNTAQQDFLAASQPSRTGDITWTEWVSNYCLGRVLLAGGQASHAYTHFQSALDSHFPYHVPLGWWFNRWPLLVCLLSGLESAANASQRDFDTTIQTYLAERQAGDEYRRGFPLLTPAQWFLEPGEPGIFHTTAFTDNFTDGLSVGWGWEDPFNDCSFEQRNGLLLHAANGRDLWHLNLSAPRLLRELTGLEKDFAIQTSFTWPDPKEQPGIGGLLIWRDEANFTRLVWGLRGASEVSFEGCAQNRNLIAGRGWLEAPEHDNGKNSPLIHLRMERHDQQIRAFCGIQHYGSSEPQRWFSLGQMDFPVQGTLRIGLHAVGWIDRTIYHGAFPGGTSICFTNFAALVK